MTARGGEFGTNWWARHWIASLDRDGWTGRFTRGRSYARNGRVLDVDIQPGVVRARVQGSESTPYRVQLRLEMLPDAVWDRVVGALSRQAIYTAKLLAGELPAEIVALCDRAEAPLFPEHPDELAMSCSCPDWAVPCKHVAAVHYALAAELDRDPFLLFRLRGRTREELTAALRARRGAMAAGSGAAPDPPATNPEPTPEAADDLSIERFWDVGSGLDELQIEIRPPELPGAVLRRLGRPPAWGASDDLVTTLHALYRVASASVRDIALSDGEALSLDADDLNADAATAQAESPGDEHGVADQVSPDGFSISPAEASEPRGSGPGSDT
ncbi:MAG: SWIM zinc finger family protein [Chloroflexi bacterium]|nr:SWIM zinc finger family protein [Chloroflexota bacterium]